MVIVFISTLSISNGVTKRETRPFKIRKYLKLIGQSTNKNISRTDTDS
jgi:hypothetical protein